MPKPTPLLLAAVLALPALHAHAQSQTQAPAQAAKPEPAAGREAYVYVPATLPPAGSRAMVIVLHGGLGNAQRIAQRGARAGGEAALNLNTVAEAGGFVVAYLNGTPVGRVLPDGMRGWNAGKCCGLPAESRVDDVAYLRAAVAELAARHGVDASRVYGLGHSNGAMMTQRLLCETRVLAAGVAVSGGLETGASRCTDAQGKRILAVHGADDQNVPVAGGVGSKGLARVAFASAQASEQLWQASGASYMLQVVPGADHAADAISARLQQTESQSLGQKAARFFGLLR